MPDRTDILIVDDESDQVRLFSDILQDSGFRTVGFDNPLRAKGYLNYKHSEILLAILDLRMPLMTGFQLIKFISQLDRIIKILIFSASELNVTELEEIQNYACLTKPISMVKLVETVNQVINSNKIMRILR